MLCEGARLTKMNIFADDKCFPRTIKLQISPILRKMLPVESKDKFLVNYCFTLSKLLKKILGSFIQALGLENREKR